MSKMGEHRIDGYFDYVVPPLEGFWSQDGIDGVDYSHKENFNWISVIRLPDFVTGAEFDWAVDTASKKKGIDCSRAEFLTVEEGLCVQIMHHGSYDDEPASVDLMHKFAFQNGYELVFSESGFETVATGVLTKRLHHEIYLSDPRKCETEKLKTVIRLPIKKI